ncbi:hypothetical protein CYLTODRAFT_485594 [Cylindrobasidium torrendii FP15055 ss-10]|uniref:F-box domain-containing protein n=1 Tax=Cylindrobasidium torrendii FP15055 ss-10 TaxID=1314674 RepID=A0A0D7BTE3_9AGAR|nr:hypothetical protein CYLTODRAFT_485594 [Cylindrobasidium torrendii FP15055 ss-10]
MPLDDLPVELYYAIIEQFDAETVRPSVLALSRAIPRSLVPIDRLFSDVTIRSTESALILYNRLRTLETTPDGKVIVKYSKNALHVRRLKVECWNVDADVLVNLIKSFKKMSILRLKVGPANFTPEHLDELVTALRRDMHELEHFACRFRPYVEKATYLPFLKGTYFDSTLVGISQWEHPALKSVSIIQDPLETVRLDPQASVHVPEGREKSFAQPIVFFRWEQPLLTLLSCDHLTALRFRLPGRPLSPAFARSTVRPYSHLRALDLSTAALLSQDVESILTRVSRIEHLILNACSTLTHQLGNGHSDSQDNWFDLGRLCATAGSRRAKEYERLLNNWLAEVIASHPKVERVDGKGAKTSTRNKPAKKGGRKGLATSTISFRQPNTGPKLPERFTTSTTDIGNIPQRVRILPAMPTIKSLSVTVASSAVGTTPTPHAQDIRDSFAAGWEQGLDVLMKQRRQHLTTWSTRLASATAAAIRSLQSSTYPEYASHYASGSSAQATSVPTIFDGALPASAFQAFEEARDAEITELARQMQILKFDADAETWEALDGYIPVGQRDMEEEDRVRDECVVPVLCFSEGKTVAEGEEKCVAGCGHREVWDM